MGGNPIFALNIVCFPTCLPVEVLGEILRGGADKVMEAGAVIVGGHSIDDKEPKYGLSVTGMVHPEKVLYNSSAKERDILILTKPIGIGIINTAVKGETASQKNIDDVFEVMAYLNKYAAGIAGRYEIHSCTDITGFGLLGHVFEMAKGSGVSINIHYDKIEKLDGAEDFARMGIIPAGAYRNREYLDGKVEFLNNLEVYKQDILFDPQTSGGLLLSVGREHAEGLFEELKSIKTACSIIGEVKKKVEKYIYVD